MNAFDIASLDTRTASTTGVKFPVKNPRTGQALLAQNGEPVHILMAGRNSATFERLAQAAAERRATLAARDVMMTADEVRQERADYVAGCTLGWNIDLIDGRAFPYSEANAATLWADRRFNWLLDATWGFLINEANFLADTPAG